MALIYFDGFDQYTAIPDPTAVAIASHVTVSPNQNNSTVPTDYGIFSPGSRRVSRFFGDDRVYLTPQGGTATGITSATGQGANMGYYPVSGTYFKLPKTLGDSTSIVVGFKIKYSDGGYYTLSSGYILPLIAFRGGESGVTYSLGIAGSTAASRAVRLYSGSSYSNTIPLAPDSSSTLGTTSSFIAGVATTDAISNQNPPFNEVPANTVEVEVTATGKFTVWINNMFVGSTQIADSVVTTAFKAIDNIRVGLIAGSATTSIATKTYGIAITDLYILDGLGSTNTRRLGKVKVVSRLPTSDVTATFKRPDDSPSNASVAASIPPTASLALTGMKEGDTDLYSSSTFNFGAESIVATSVTTTGFKTDPSGNDIAGVLSISGTSYVGTTNVVPISSTIMKSKQAIYENNPRTSRPFTKAELDATNFGVIVVAPNTDG